MDVDEAIELDTSLGSIPSTGATTIKFNDLKTENEVLLFKHTSKLNQKLNLILLENQKQKQELHLLAEKIAQIELNSAIQQQVTFSLQNQTQQDTEDADDIEVAGETEWIVKRKRKKRKANSSPEVSPAHKAPLVQITELQKSNALPKPVLKKEPQPPPITVKKSNYEDLYLLLKKENCLFTAKLLSSGEIKLNSPNSDEYRKIVKTIKATKLTWYTYEDKQTRPIRVIAKKLPPSCLPESIIKDLRDNQGFKIIEAVNILDRKTKERLPTFMLTFNHDEDISKIYEIKNILGVKVQIEPKKSSKQVPQCKKCQRYGHTQKYCQRDPKCVKCAGEHLSSACPQQQMAKPKCINCGENHPANYRGCIVAKEMQKMRNNDKKAKKSPQANFVQRSEIKKAAKVSVRTAAPAKQVTIEQSYARIARRNSTSSVENHSSLELLVKEISDKIGKIDTKIETISKRVGQLEINYQSRPTTSRTVAGRKNTH